MQTRYYFIRLTRVIPGLVGKNELVIMTEDEVSAAEHASRTVSQLQNEDGSPVVLNRSDIASIREITQKSATELTRRWRSGASTT